jgi:RNA-directed DNA polymerase
MIMASALVKAGFHVTRRRLSCGTRAKAAKTGIVHLTDGGEGFDFLGFHHRLVRGRTPKSAHLTFLARWPSRQVTQRARDRIREITDRSRLLVPVEDLVKEINLFLRGWAGYFRYGNSARVLGQIRNYALRPDRAAAVQARQATTILGLGHDPGTALTGSPGPDPPRWSRRSAQTLPGLAGKGRTPTVKNVGKPGAGEPHARFDGRGLETDRIYGTAPAPDPPRFFDHERPASRRR